MQLQTLWAEFSTKQLDYITNIIKNSDAKSICELGTFDGTSAKHIWDGIKDTDKKLYLVDNYFFLPKKYRWHFFNTIKNSIDKDTKNIIPILQSSHKYDWTQHVIFVLGREKLNCTLPTKNKLFFHQQIKCMPKGTGTYLQAIKDIQNMLGIKK